MEMNDQIVTAIDHLCSKFGLAIDWTGENVMPYLQDLCARYIQYEMWSSVGLGVFLIALMIVMAFWLRFCFRKYDNSSWYSNWDVVWYVSLILGVTLYISGAISLVCVVDTVIKCSTIPEAVFVSYLFGLGT